MTTAPPIKAPWGLGKALPPLGLSYVAAALEKAGFQVEVLDNYLLKKPINYVKQMVRRLNPEIVGITCGSVTYRRCVETARAVKEALPSCRIAPRALSSLYEEILQKGLYDRVEDFVTYVKTKDFDYESLLELQKRFHIEFNRSPKRILRKIRQEGFLTILRKSLRP